MVISFSGEKQEMKREPKNEKEQNNEQEQRNEKVDDNKWAATSSFRFIIIANERVHSLIILTIYSDWWRCDLTIVV